MGFDYDKYSGGGGDYIDAAEKKVLRENGIPIIVTGIREEAADENRFDQHRFVLTVEIPNPETGEDEERLLTFPIGSGVESRDRMIAAMQRHIDETGEQLVIKVSRIGKSDVLVSGEADPN